jgi:hypothetical protein
MVLYFNDDWLIASTSGYLHFIMQVLSEQCFPGHDQTCRCLPMPRMRSPSARADRNGIRNRHTERRHDNRTCDPASSG